MDSERGRKARRWAVIAAVVLPALGLSLAAQQSTSLVVNGQQGSAKVVEVGGHNYVDVDGLARITNGTISFKGNQIVLSVPGLAAATAAPEEAKGFSKDFMTAAIEAMARVREWHAALRTAIEKGVPIADDWLGTYQTQAQQSLRLSAVAINTDADRKAYPFMVSEFNNMRNLNESYVAKAKALDYIDPSSLQSDPLNQKVVACGHTLMAMASTKQFIDDGSCQ
jgi:hypothetical protein